MTPPRRARFRRLLLFDIDGTLLDTGGCGCRAIIRALERALDVPASRIPELDLAGATDSGLLRDLLTGLGIEPTSERVEVLLEVYHEELGSHLAATGRNGTPLPGVSALLDELRPRPATVTALLTGNSRHGAFTKLAHYGLDHHFTTGAFGDDHHDRNALGPIAIERASSEHGHDFVPEDTVIIGDTPKDIRCARACGATAVAVATGTVAREQLEAHQPDHLLDDLSDLEAVLGILLAD